MNCLYIKDLTLLLATYRYVDQKQQMCKNGPLQYPTRYVSKVIKFFSIFIKNIHSERYDLNHFIRLSVNLITLSFCSKIPSCIVPNAFYRSINIIPVNKPSSKPFKTLSVYLLNKTNIDLLNDYIKTLIGSHMSSPNNKAFVSPGITLSMIFITDGSNEIWPILGRTSLLSPLFSK